MNDSDEDLAHLRKEVESLRDLIATYEAELPKIRRSAARAHVEGKLAAAREWYLTAAAELTALEKIKAAEKRLPFAERSGKVEGEGMTAAQTLRRGNAIAKAHAEKTGDAFQKAVTSSEWHSQARYARQRLKISPSTLSEYRKGAYPTPRKIAEKAEKDLGIAPDKKNWPGGIVD